MSIKWLEVEWVFDEVEFGIWVREWRRYQRMEQQELAERIGYKTGTSIGAIERGRMQAGFPMDKFIRLCALMDVDPRAFFSIQPNV